MLANARRPAAVVALLLALTSLVACAPRATAPRRFTLLAINDVYRIEGVEEGARGGLARVRTLRAELAAEHPGLVFLHAGDFLFPSLLSQQYGGEQMVDVMNLLDGEAQGFDDRFFVTFGNHEFDKDKLKDAALVERRIEESHFTWLGSDLDFAAGDDGAPVVAAPNLVRSAVVESGGVKVGLFSLTTGVKHPAYVERFEPPVEVARRETAALRGRGAEVVVALTHQRLSQDEALLHALGDEGPELVIGGHEHQRQEVQVDGRWILKADADARTATVATVTLPPGGPPAVEHTFRELGPATAPDGAVAARVDDWLARHDREYCAEKLGLPPGCLATVVGHTQVRLTAEELEIRRFETNLGDWIVDQARAAFAADGAQIAFVNAGSLRLNQDIPAGTDLTLRHVGEIFAYPSPMQLLRIDGATLRRVISHAVEDWTGNGWFLQVSGFAYRHDPTAGTAGSLTLLTADGERPIRDDETLLAVTSGFLLDPSQGQDGYTMLDPSRVVATGRPDPDLRDLVVEGLEAAGSDGIAPAVEGRICNGERPGPCLAAAGG